ncbi:MAG: bifunctional nuclease family protein [Calditrichaeota bacterium]|nr:bifunctional nuclease family protein [Calditrichota bacterium]MCB9366482.1 bifunctional nuclease family protein [Calditrichota bacterium]MCB9391260.1 bifunctional nuclease family protein [Calditrichota bacterium]
MISVEVIGISVCPPYQGYVVILKEKEGERWLPIFIGAAEAQSISLLLQGLEYARPMTYDLFAAILEEGGVSVNSTTICDLKDNTFYAEVELQITGDEIRRIDARPSDAIALALKSKAPIQVANKVMDSAAVSNEPVNRSIVEQIAYLHQKLKEYVEVEAYEEAAKIRDHIRSLETRLSEHEPQGSDGPTEGKA